MKKIILLLIGCVAILYVFFSNSVKVNSLEEMPNLYSQNAILIDLNHKRILLKKGIDEMIYPASLTKVMTVIVAIEHFKDLQTKLTIDGEILEKLRLQNASVAGFQGGDQPTVEELLYAAILSSGADATSTLAVAIAGSEEDFAKLMNEKAKSLGMEHTYFMNASGLHHPNHYSTVEDLSKLMMYALQNKEFEKIFTTASYITSPLQSKPSGIVLQSTMFAKLWSSKFENGVEIIGGKTGYTEEAGLCLASLARKDGSKYLLITANAKGNIEKYDYHIDDAELVYSLL